MRYKPEHKQKTKARIVQVAGRLFRARGYDGVGIDEIMAAAGLTRGGFYGHFRSKQDLFAAVLADEHDFNRRMRARAGKTSKDLRAGALAVANGYLDPANRKAIGRGCPMASLSADVARAGKATRHAYADSLRDLAREFARGMTPKDGTEELDPRALSAIALCVGGITLARGVDDEDLSAAILAACRDAVARELNVSRASSASSSTRGGP